MKGDEMASNDLNYMKAKRAKYAKTFNAMAHTLTTEQIRQHYVDMEELDCRIARFDPTQRVEKRRGEDGETRTYIVQN
jgi:hypothetical protein